MPQNKLADIRRKRGKGDSLLDFHYRTDIPYNTLKAIERGQVQPEPHEVELLANAYGLSEDELREIVGMEETPQCIGKREALEYMAMYPDVTKSNFMYEGRADIERDYEDKASQEEYIKGWESVWNEKQEAPIESEDDFRKREF